MAPGTTLTVSAAATAAFTQQQPPRATLAVRPNSTNGGTVVVNTPQDCTGGFRPGTQVSVNAAPNAGWTFAGWSGAAWVFAQGGTSPECTLTLSAPSGGFPAQDGQGSVGVTAPAGSTCPWVAVSDSVWLSVLGGGGGSGSGQVAFAVSANSGVARVATLAIGGQTFTVYQAGSNCGYALTPAGMSFPTGGGTGSFAVAAAAGCPWTAVPAASWLHVTSGAQGLGNGTVGFSVDANTGGARAAAIAVADQAFAVTQAAYIPPLQAAFSLVPASPVVGDLVEFVDSSPGVPTSWSWSFGDGTASTLENPTHTYQAPGTYTVALTVANAGATSSTSHAVTVAPAFASWLPVVSRGGGVGGSVWRSDVGVLNPSTAAASVEALFHGSGGVAAGSAVVPAGGQLIVRDIVGQLGVQGSGALELRSDQAVVVTSRTYDDSGVGTVGGEYGASVAGGGLGAGQSAWLPQLEEDAAYRTDISLTNTGTGPAAVTVTLFDGTGTKVGSYDVALAAGGWSQATQPFLVKGGQTAMGAGYAEVTVTSGAGVVAAASVIDNRTDDPTIIPMTPTVLPGVG